MVAVWIDIRTTPIPLLPEGALPPHVRLDEHRLISNPLSEGFFVRSLVYSADGRTLLNPQSDVPADSRASLLHRGYFSYAQVKAKDYLPMLKEAVARLPGSPGSTAA